MRELNKKYRRPDQQWKCGLQEKGVLCVSGPDHRRQCPEQTCYPRRTLQWWRQYLPVAFGTITLAVLISVENMPVYRTVIAPGPLTLSHAQLISNPEDPHRCSACHDENPDYLLTTNGAVNLVSNPTSNPTSNLMSRLSEQVIAKHSQSDRCVSCHVRDMPNLAIRTPHDLPIEVVSGLSDTVAPLLFNEDFACSRCHLEHQGPNHDLQAIASDRCQACHQQTFASFSAGHPPFENYPAPKTRRLAFDHRKHQDSHFTKTGTSFDCRRCHMDSAQISRVGQVFRSRSFEVSCAQCHESSILSSMSDGAIVFQVPNMDLEAIARRGLEITDWPDEASLMMDGKLPLLMQWLLLNEAEGALTLSGLDANADISKLRVDSDVDRNTISSLTATSKMMVAKIGRLGQSAFEQRFVTVNENQTRDTISRGANAILRGAPPDLFRIAFDDWFNPSKQKGGQWKPPRASHHLKTGGWMIDSQRLAIAYVPTGHADAWLANIIELSAEVIQESTQRVPSDHRMRVIAEQLLSAQGIGRCTECHSNFKNASSESRLVGVDLGQSNRGSTQVNDRWHAERFSVAVRQLTKFDHGPHLIQPQLQSCVACHAWNEAKKLDDNLSEFSALKIEQCTSCHLPNAAGDHCTQCHNYHANQR